MITEPIPPTKMYCGDRNKEERKDEEAQVNETEASLEASKGETRQESIKDNLELHDIEEMVNILTENDTMRT